MNIRINIIVFLCSLLELILGCKGDSNKHIIEYYKNGNPSKEYYIDKVGKKTGPFKQYYSNGRVQAQSNYLKGVLDGTIIEYYQNGTIKSIGYFKSGKPDSTALFFYPNGALRAKNYFYQGKAFGLHQQFSENGSLESMFFMANDSCMVSSIDLAKSGEIKSKKGNLTYCVYNTGEITAGDTLGAVFYTYSPPKYHLKVQLVEIAPTGNIQRENCQLDSIEGSVGYLLYKSYKATGHYKVGFVLSLLNDSAWLNYTDSTFVDFNVK